MLDYSQLEVLDVIVTQGSFQGAARALHLTQPAVSQRLKSLEEEIGGRLLNRAQPPRVTPLGGVLLEHVRRVKRLEQDVTLALQVDGGVGFSTITLGVNSDSLATWFFDAFSPVVQQHSFLLDLIIENEDVTFARLQRGEVLGCISSRARRLPGCEVQRLGIMRYHCAATATFQRKYFKNGLTRESVLAAPAVIFDRFDDMHQRFLEKHFAFKDLQFPQHRIAGSHAFLDAIRYGIAYGMAPERQAAADFRAGRLVKLTPRKVWTQELFWHFQRQGDRHLRKLYDEVITHARKALR